MTHTPGKWVAVNDTDVDTVDGSCIAVMGIGVDDYSANARLIASAPDLLEVLDHPLLRKLLGAIEDSGTPESDKLWGMAMQWLDLRDAAISKARSA